MKTYEKQMATVSFNWKPTQRERFGKFSEGLPGFTKSVACVERNAQGPFGGLRTGLGDPVSSCGNSAGRRTEMPSRKAKDNRGSDQLVVL